MKFGGTSMGSADRIRVAGEIIGEQQRERPVTVVVSAMSKVTDLLLETMHRAELGDLPVVAVNIQNLLERHLQTCDELLNAASAAESRMAASEAVRSLVAEFERITSGIRMLG